MFEMKYEDHQQMTALESVFHITLSIIEKLQENDDACNRISERLKLRQDYMVDRGIA